MSEIGLNTPEEWNWILLKLKWFAISIEINYHTEHVSPWHLWFQFVVKRNRRTHEITLMGFHIHCSRFKYNFVLLGKIWNSFEMNFLSELNWDIVLFWTLLSQRWARRVQAAPRNWKQLYSAQLRWVVLCSLRERFVKVSTKLTF